jgi:hypothetical protein
VKSVAAIDPALTPGDPRATVHFAVARAFNRDLASEAPPESGYGDSVLAWHAARDDPESRAVYAVAVSISWGYLAAGCAFAIVACGFAVDMLIGDEARNLVAFAWLGAGFFCIAGFANVQWRKLQFVPAARRLQNNPGQRDAYAAAMRNTLPRNSSLLFQSAVGVAAFVIALLSV